MHFLLNWKSLNLYENTHNYRSYMFRSSTILRELVQSLAIVTLLIKHSVKLRRCILCGDVAACLEMVCVLFVVQTDVCTNAPAHKLFANLYDIYHCCVYSEKLLVMDRGTVRNR